jgi:hypothetical protein
MIAQATEISVDDAKMPDERKKKKRKKSQENATSQKASR